MLTKETVINRIKKAFDEIKSRNEPYYVGEQWAMRKARQVILKAQSFGYDDRHQLMVLMNKQMQALELSPGNDDAEGRICGYAVALAMYHDNNREMQNESAVPF
jgi:hypothetical protein